AATTPIADLLRGLEALRAPRAFTSIAGFMSRYADVIAGEMRRMSIARRSRAHDPRYVWQARGTAAVAGTLFVRSFERGERIYAAMLSRGFTGELPRYATVQTSGRQWAWAAVAPGAAAAVAAAAWLAR
ncbi:MAG: energy-coupling factor transporter transmembrane protein EcfT, partial [Actinomycetota bacterium]|nr:energy-coupling factor transporter transmembrane protein EcfT [Actinomycetota bacterium]